MNQVMSFDIERKYASTMKSCSDLTQLQNKINEMANQLAYRTTKFLNSESVQKILQTHKIQQLGIKSKQDTKKDSLSQEIGVKDQLLTKITNKNKVLLLEKNRHLRLLMKKGKREKGSAITNLLEFLQ